MAIRNGLALRPRLGSTVLLPLTLHFVWLQSVVSLTHAGDGTINLLLTDVLDLIRMTAVVPLGSSDHSSLTAVLSMAQAVPYLYFSRKVFLKYQVN